VECLGEGALVDMNALVADSDVTISFPHSATSWLRESEIDPTTPSACGPRIGFEGSIEGLGALGKTSWSVPHYQ